MTPCTHHVYLLPKIEKCIHNVHLIAAETSRDSCAHCGTLFILLYDSKSNPDRTLPAQDFLSLQDQGDILVLQIRAPNLGSRMVSYHKTHGF